MDIPSGTQIRADGNRYPVIDGVPTGPGTWEEPSEGGGGGNITSYVHDGEHFVETPTRRFVGPGSPIDDGFTLDDGDEVIVPTDG